MTYKRIIAEYLNIELYSLSGILQDGMFGDKEIAVKIRGNSHYRNSVCQQTVKSECLSLCDT